MAQPMPLSLTVSCFSKIQIGFAFLVPAHPGSPGQWAVKRRECVHRHGVVRAVCANDRRGHQHVLDQTLPHQEVRGRPGRRLVQESIQFRPRTRRLLPRSVPLRHVHSSAINRTLT